MKIRDYRKEDFIEFCKLMNELNDYIVSIDSEKIVKSLSSQSDIETYAIQSIKNSDKQDGFTFLALENSKIIGLIQGITNHNDRNLLYKLTHEPFSDGWITELFVKPEFRGRGIGKALISKANYFFHDKGCRFIRLQVMNDNTESLDIYKKLGFKVRDLELTNEL
jgi:ribosomal protein S18 acetylase RimI-like enzyme